MFRRISTKLVVAVLAAVALPFVSFAWFVDTQVGQELSLKVARETLKGVAVNLSHQVDVLIRERVQDMEKWSSGLQIKTAIEGEQDAWRAEHAIAFARGELDAYPEADPIFEQQTEDFDDSVRIEAVYELILLVDGDGRLRACNSRDAEGRPLDAALVRSLFERGFRDEPWFRTGLAGRAARVDWHRSPYVPEPLAREPGAAPAYHVGFSAPVLSDTRPGHVVGVLYSLVSWRHFQDLVRVPVIKDYFRGLVPPDTEPSPYAWIWGADNDTIQAHDDPTLYGEKVSGPRVGLMTMVEDARSAHSGLYREYVFKSKRKNAAFCHCEEPMRGDDSWVVGVGINNEDIFRKEQDMTEMLVKATLVVLLVVVLWTMIIARRTTSPILELQEHTKRVAEGDWNAQIDIRTRDELGELAYAFNRMTRELREQRDQLVRAEKDAAWREMARQIAHDIKNPLTPIKLSLDLLDRARREDSEDLESILDRVCDLMNRQVENLREIATDFYEFTGGRKPRPEPVDLGGVVEELFQLNEAWAEELGVRMELRGERHLVWADPQKLRRVLTNVLSNALQAMPDGGELVVELSRTDGRVTCEVRDTGRGIDPEVREHLFEPYFTTRSEGTGLGLAIAKRVLEEMHGEIDLIPREDGEGTVARLTVPAHDGGAS